MNLLRKKKKSYHFRAIKLISTKSAGAMATQLMHGEILGILQQLVASPCLQHKAYALLQWECLCARPFTPVSTVKLLVSLPTSSKYGLVVPHHYPFYFKHLSHLGLFFWCLSLWFVVLAVFKALVLHIHPQ